MHMRINRNQTEPPPRDYSNRNTLEAIEDRREALEALQSLDLGQSVEFTGEEVTRDRINNMVAVLSRPGSHRSFSTAKIPEGIGVWRTA